MTPLIALDPAAIAAFSLNVLLLLSAVCLIALIAVRHLFRHHPSVRYFVCLAGLICTLLSPLVVYIQDQVGCGLVTLSLHENFSMSPAPVAEISAALVVDAETNVGVGEASLMHQWISWGLWAMLAAWVTGVAWGALRFARGWRAASRLTQGIRPWNASAHIERLDQLECLLGSPIPPIFTSPHVMSPVVVGVFHPVVILPEGLTETLAPAPLRQVLLHECAHVVFRHTFSGVVERVAGLLFWPHPLVHLLGRELARSREEVCDNLASQQDGAACYARTLLAMAQGMFAAPNLISTLALQGSGPPLEERIAGLLGPRRNSMARMNRWKQWAVSGVAVSAMALTAMVRVVAAEVEVKQDTTQASGYSAELTVAPDAEVEAVVEPTENPVEAAEPAENPVEVVEPVENPVAVQVEATARAEQALLSEDLIAKLKAEADARAKQALLSEDQIAKLKAEADAKANQALLEMDIAEKQKREAKAK